jgi:hypothetical protein
MTELVGKFIMNVKKSQASNWKYEYLFLNNTVNEWFLFKFNEMMIMSALHLTNMLCWISIILAH